LEDWTLARSSLPSPLLRLGQRLVAAGLPEPLLVVLLPSRRWALLAVWCICSRAAARAVSRCGIIVGGFRIPGLLTLPALLPRPQELGPPFILVSMGAFIFANLGKRRGALSAYSLFNPGQRALPGTMGAEAVDASLRQAWTM